MKVATIADVKARLNAYVKQCQTEGPVVITQKGQAVAALLVPVDEDELERLVLAHSPRFQAMLNKSHESIQSGRGLSSEEFWKAVKQRRSQKSKAKRTDRNS